MMGELLSLLGMAAEQGIRGYAALLLGLAAFAKLRDLPSFEAAIAGYRLLPLALLAPTARALPAIELAVAVTLPLPAAGRGAAVVAAALLLLFTGAVTINLLRGRTTLACGCGTDATIGWPLAFGNAGLAILLLATLPMAPTVPMLILTGGTMLGLALWLVRHALMTLPRLARNR